MIRFLHRLLLLAALAGSLIAIPPAVAADAFVPGIDDLPLMPALRPMLGDSVVFDVPGGRVVDAWAQGAVASPAIQAFYASTLPQLGWRATGTNQFRREGETLRLEFPAAGPRGSPGAGQVVVRFYLSPG